MRPLPDWLTTGAIAHRGLHDARAGVPENTLAAFDAAIRHGYPIELDLNLSADGRAMVFHDARLDRLTDWSGPLGERTAGELADARVLGTDQRISTLEDVLAHVAGRVPLLIELKTWSRTPGALEGEVVRRLKGYRGEVALQAFNPLSLAWFHRNAPGHPRGQISGDYRRYGDRVSPSLGTALARLQLNHLSRPDFIGYDVRALPSSPAARIRRAGLPVFAWTVRNARDRARARAHADGVIFEGYLA